MKKIILTLLIFSLLFSTFSTFSHANSVLDKHLKEVEHLLYLSQNINANNKDYFINSVNKFHLELEKYHLKDITTEDDKKFNLLYAKLAEINNIADSYINNNTNTKNSVPLNLNYYKPFSSGDGSGHQSSRWRYGDILVYITGSTNANGEKSLTGHTAVLSTIPYYVIEASKTKSHGAKVFHWDRKYLWKGASGIRQLQVTSSDGKAASFNDRFKAVQYGLEQVGEPYRLRTPLSNTDEWYCSKLTYAQWKSVGYDISGIQKWRNNEFRLIIPDQILHDSNTRIIKYWDRELPGLL